MDLKQLVHLTFPCKHLLHSCIQMNPSTGNFPTAALDIIFCTHNPILDYKIYTNNILSGQSAMYKLQIGTSKFMRFNSF